MVRLARKHWRRRPLIGACPRQRLGRLRREASWRVHCAARRSNDSKFCKWSQDISRIMSPMHPRHRQSQEDKRTRFGARLSKSFYPAEARSGFPKAFTVLPCVQVWHAFMVKKNLVKKLMAKFSQIIAQCTWLVHLALSNELVVCSTSSCSTASCSTCGMSREAVRDEPQEDGQCSTALQTLGQTSKTRLRT